MPYYTITSSLRFMHHYSSGAKAHYSSSTTEASISFIRACLHQERHPHLTRSRNAQSHPFDDSPCDKLNSILGLNLVVPLHYLRITRGSTRFLASCAHTWSCRLSRRRWCRSATPFDCIVVASLRGMALKFRRSRGGSVVTFGTVASYRRWLSADVVVCYTCRLGVWNGLVVIVALGIFGYDVPGMQKPGKVTEHA